MPHILFLQSVPWAGIKWLEDTVAISLLVLSIIIAVIIVGRYLKFKRSKETSRTYAPQLSSAIRKLKWEEALAISEKYERKSHLAGAILFGLREGGLPNRALPEVLVIKHMGQAMERAVIVINHQNRRGLGILDAIGATSPFIGALGGSVVVTKSSIRAAREKHSRSNLLSAVFLILITHRYSLISQTA